MWQWQLLPILLYTTLPLTTDTLHSLYSLSLDYGIVSIMAFTIVMIIVGMALSHLLLYVGQMHNDAGIWAKWSSWLTGLTWCTVYYHMMYAFTLTLTSSVSLSYAMQSLPLYTTTVMPFYASFLSGIFNFSKFYECYGERALYCTILTPTDNGNMTINGTMVNDTSVALDAETIRQTRQIDGDEEELDKVDEKQLSALIYWTNTFNSTGNIFSSDAMNGELVACLLVIWSTVLVITVAPGTETALLIILCGPFLCASFVAVAALHFGIIGGESLQWHSRHIVDAFMWHRVFMCVIRSLALPSVVILSISSWSNRRNNIRRDVCIVVSSAIIWSLCGVLFQLSWTTRVPVEHDTSPWVSAMAAISTMNNRILPFSYAIMLPAAGIAHLSIFVLTLSRMTKRLPRIAQRVGICVVATAVTIPFATHNVAPLMKLLSGDSPLLYTSPVIILLQIVCVSHFYGSENQANDLKEMHNYGNTFSTVIGYIQWPLTAILLAVLSCYNIVLLALAWQTASSLSVWLLELILNLIPLILLGLAMPVQYCLARRNKGAVIPGAAAISTVRPEAIDDSAVTIKLRQSAKVMPISFEQSRHSLEMIEDDGRVTHKTFKRMVEHATLVRGTSPTSITQHPADDPFVRSKQRNTMR